MSGTQSTRSRTSRRKVGSSALKRSSPILGSRIKGSSLLSRSSQPCCEYAAGSKTRYRRHYGPHGTAVSSGRSPNSPAVATDAHISVIGHITQDELQRTLAECEGFNGFANRFLWLAVRRSKLLPDGGQDLDQTRHAPRLALAAEQARSVDRMQRDQAAAALWRQVYGELADDQTSGLLGAVTSRAEAQVLRLSMTYALLDGYGTISECHLRAALPCGGTAGRPQP